MNVWVGVHVENELGAFSVYFGENDDRNSTEVFQIEDVLQDDDYASVLVSVGFLLYVCCMLIHKY